MLRVAKAFPMILLVTAVPLSAVDEPISDTGSAAPLAPIEEQLAAGDRVLQLDRLLAESRRDEANAVYEQLLDKRTDAVAAGLELLTHKQTSSALTVSYLCELASKEVPAETSTALLAYVLPSAMDDLTKTDCIHSLSDRIDNSFRDPLVQLATAPGRDPNLRIAALKTATSNWPLESHATLLQLLKSKQSPIMHHKAQQYLVRSGHTDTDALIKEFVLNRDPATAGVTLPKEYGLLMLWFRQREKTLPLLRSILHDESWPSEIQDRVLDLLSNSDVPGGRAILMDARDHVGKKLRSRIDAVLTEKE